MIKNTQELGLETSPCPQGWLPDRKENKTFINMDAIYNALMSDVTTLLKSPLHK